MHEYRTKTCNDLRIDSVGSEVKLAGFIRTVRDLGSVMFVDIVDHYGTTQLLINEEEMLETFRKIPVESSISIVGDVIKRDEENVNKNIETGEIEVKVKEVKILGRVDKTLPFSVDESYKVREDLRLEYRFLDLRNERIHKKLIFRSKVLKTLRDKMDEMGFVEIQTPVLTSSSPEGARDFLVPSRLHPGEFYALPQAPQQFKQLLMISGFDKYYQIAPCFRDEDPRADRSPGEFYQLDFEMAYATQEDVLKVLEEVVSYTFKKLGKKEVSDFIRIPFREAMDKYGSDKPDLRNPLILQNVTDAFIGSGFKVFEDKHTKAIKIEASEVTRKFFDEMADYATSELEMKGLAWVKFDENMNVSGTISRFVVGSILEKLKQILDLKPNDAVFFIADEYNKCCKDAGSVRIELGKRLGLIDESIYRFCFIVDFPMYELNDEGKLDFCHNPFSMPKGGLEALNTKNPLDIDAYQYDLVCNGYELASGAVRNHEIDVMKKAFEIVGYSSDEVEKRFGALYTAFQYGAPPHAGGAPGIDRMIMLLLDETNIREVVAFPKNSKARDLLMKAPSAVSEMQLRDVHIKLR